MEGNIYSIAKEGKAYYITEDGCVFRNVFDARAHAAKIIKDRINRNRIAEARSYINIK